MPACLRFATEEDLGRLSEIEADADVLLVEYLNAGRWPTALSGSTRASEPGFILVAAESSHGDAVGFAHVLEGDGNGHLEQLSVLRSRCRRGYGRALVEAAKNEAAVRGRSLLTLRTYADVPWNGPFYASCGFVESDVDTEFHRRLSEAEAVHDLARYGSRIQMSAVLGIPREHDRLTT